jgi:tRNA-specific 2-thiouridylase
LRADQASWIAGVFPASGRLAAKTRYRQEDAQCVLEGARDDAFQLAFDEPQWAITPGQSAVLYQGDICLGGGIIDTAVAA